MAADVSRGRSYEGDDDLVGLIAYGLYKQEKRDWIVRRLAATNAPPSQDDLDRFTESFSEAGLARFRKQAEDMMVAFASVIVEDRAPEIREEAIRSAVATNHQELLVPAARTSGCI